MAGPPATYAIPCDLWVYVWANVIRTIVVFGDVFFDYDHINMQLYMILYAMICNYMQLYAVICSYMQLYAVICSYAWFNVPYET